MNESLLLMGSNSRTRACLEALVAAGEPPRALALDRDAPSLAERAFELGVPVVDGRHPRADEGRARLTAVGARRWVMAGYARILPPEALVIPPDGVINLHGGKLPEYRGASVVNWQLIEGERAMGLTVLRADAGIDTGDILARDALPVGPDEDYGSVQARMNARFPTMLLAVLSALREGRAVGERQDLSVGRTWPRRRPEDGLIDWSAAPARRLHDFVRALARPCPGAFCAHHGERLTVWRTRVIEERGEFAAPGTVTGFHDGAPCVAAREGTVALIEADGPTLRAGDVLGGVR